MPQNLPVLEGKLGQPEHLLQYTQEISRLIYTINTIEGFNLYLYKATKSKSIFLTDDSLLKILYLAMMDITKKKTGRWQDFSMIHA